MYFLKNNSQYRAIKTDYRCLKISLINGLIFSLNAGVNFIFSSHPVSIESVHFAYSKYLIIIFSFNYIINRIWRLDMITISYRGPFSKIYKNLKFSDINFYNCELCTKSL